MAMSVGKWDVGTHSVGHVRCRRYMLETKPEIKDNLIVLSLYYYTYEYKYNASVYLLMFEN